MASPTFINGDNGNNTSTIGGILNFIWRVGVISAIALGSLGMTWYQLNAYANTTSRIEAKMDAASLKMTSVSEVNKQYQVSTSEDVKRNQRLLRQICVGISTLAKLPTTSCTVE